MKKRNYSLLLGGQFLSAFGDQAILAIILGPLLFLKDSGQISEEDMRTANIFYTVLLFVPCVLFAPLAGFFNDRFPKSVCLVAGNVIKLAGAVVCAVGLIWHFPLPGIPSGNLVLGAGYFIIGIGTCLYGPAKYGVLPEILPREHLVRANGMVEMLTLLSVLGGFICGSWLADFFRESMGVPHGIIIALYAVALILNAFMSRTPESPETRLRESAGAFFGHLRDLLTAPRLRLMLVGTAMFWIVGAAMKSHFQPWGSAVLKLKTNTEISLLALMLSLGVMLGSLVAGRLRGVGDVRGIPRAGFALAGVFVLAWTVGFGDTAWLAPQITVAGCAVVLPVAVLLVVAGLFAGLFLIPLNAALQDESDPAKLGKTIAVQNLFDYLGMCGAGAYLFLTNAVGVSTQGVFLGLALGTAAVAFWMLRSGRLTPPVRPETLRGQ
jgi:LPLT family lysophospholipid transporter-like MFS transporter